MSENNKSTTANASAGASTKKPVVNHSSPVRKLLQLSHSLQFAWFVGHVITLVGSIICFASMGNRFFYRVTWFGVLESFGIITYQHYYPKATPNAQNQMTPQALLQNSDVLYFALALVWFLTPTFTFALVPYATFSLFHVLIYCKSVLMPEVMNLTAENSKLVSMIDNFVRNYNEKCMYWVGTIELGLEALLALRAMVFYTRSWIVLLAYSLFIKIRFENSKYMQAAFAQWRVRLDGIMSHPSVPLIFKRGYGKAKSMLISVSHFRLSKAQATAASSNKTE